MFIYLEFPSSSKPLIDKRDGLFYKKKIKKKKLKKYKLQFINVFIVIYVSKKDRVLSAF